MVPRRYQRRMSIARSVKSPGAFRFPALLAGGVAVALAGCFRADDPKSVALKSSRPAPAARVQADAPRSVVRSQVPENKDTTMNPILSKRLGSSAKKIALRSPGDETVSTLIQVAPSIDRLAFERDVTAYGGSLRSWLPEANVVTVDIGARHLSELADLDGVVQVEAGQKYQR